jgi:hypothetical protein
MLGIKKYSCKYCKYYTGVFGEPVCTLFYDDNEYETGLNLCGNLEPCGMFDFNAWRASREEDE